MTHPARQAQAFPNTKISVRSNVLDCAVESVSALGEFHGWGRDPQLTLYTNETVPGSVVRIEVKTTFRGQGVVFEGKLAESYVPTK